MTDWNHVAMAEVRCHEVGEQTGENWGVSSTDALRSYLLNIESALRICDSDSYTFADLDRWEIDRERVDEWSGSRDEARREDVAEVVSYWPLSIETLSRQSLGTDAEPQLERVEFLLGCGGPNVCLVLDLRERTVTLKRRWWCERSDADCRHEDAVELMARFVEYFFGLELDR